MQREETSLAKIKASAAARETHLNKQQDRKRDAVVLILDFLCAEGYTSALANLEAETGISLSKYRVCDNMDLLYVVQQFQEYFSFKFDKEVRIVRKSTGDTQMKAPPRPVPKPTANSSTDDGQRTNSRDIAPSARKVKQDQPTKEKEKEKEREKEKPMSKDGKGEFLMINGVKIPYTKKNQETEETGNVIPQPLPNPSTTATQEDVYNVGYQPVKKAVPVVSDGPRLNLVSNSSLGDNGLGALFGVIKAEILTELPQVRFKDIIGLTGAKRILREAVILPRKYPQLFLRGDGIGSLSWKGLLVYGSPGSGKTCLAKALATESRSVFFCVSSATLTSKYHGESEKLVRCLFIMARQYESAVVFFDEVDSILSSRASEGEHEASRRMKSEMLQQIDGLHTSLDEDHKIFVLCATNFPWDIDRAMLRRLEKRVFVELPGLVSRVAMIRSFLGERLSTLPDVQNEVTYEQYKELITKATSGLEEVVSTELFEALEQKLATIGLAYLMEFAVETAAYSGADLRIVCTEACMIKVRHVLDMLEDEFATDQAQDIDPHETDARAIEEYLETVFQGEDRAVDESDVVLDDTLLDLSVGPEELRHALAVTKPSADPSVLKQYSEWSLKYGSS
ncbi:P60 katanin [Giardia muris]|uniref:P60 katanin n=1 Tax=Giardia muris TaxID=5742 RepID=A0A4Z1SWA8_GIAMU|nr:P60 katanin [Giardia muris]|eukprot:TNJ30112.1 P60 katanin [Giardia muris]